jgi:hypothetical protein
MVEILKMVVAGVIASGIVTTLIGALAWMTWGRITDRFQNIDNRHQECSVETTACLKELYGKAEGHETRISVLENKVDN